MQDICRRACGDTLMRAADCAAYAPPRAGEERNSDKRTMGASS
jgi:hypothetical protein